MQTHTHWLEERTLNLPVILSLYKLIIGELVLRLFWRTAENVNMGHKTRPPHSHLLTLITPIEPNNSDSLSVLTSSGRPVTYTASSRCFFSIGPAREGGKTSVTTHPLLPYEDYKITGSYVIYSPSISMLPVVIVIRYKG